MMLEIQPTPEEGVLTRYRWTPDFYVDLVPGIFNVSLKVGREAMLGELGYDEVYDYTSFARALAAVLAWATSGQAEPALWIRHMPSGRRRPNGDITLEYIEGEYLTLTGEDSRTFVENLLNPPALTSNFLDALSRYKSEFP